MRVCLIVPLLMLSCLHANAQDELVLDDDFSTYAAGSNGSPNWVADSIWWEARDGAYRFDGRAPGVCPVADERLFGEMTIEATLTLSESHGTEWKTAGIVVFTSYQDHWHLALVESPDDSDQGHFVELSEMLHGEWLSQQKLAPLYEGQGNEFAWEYGRPYLLRIELDAETISGTVTDVATGEEIKLGYRFTAEAVTRGRPAVRTNRFSGSYDDVSIRASDPVAPPIVTRPPFAVASDDPVIGAATGFFHVKEVDGVWWIVSPEGKRFYAVGTDHCNYRGHWCEKLGYAPYGQNMRERFGSADAWAEVATGRLKDWSFNLLGAGNGRETQYRGLAHTRFAAFGTTFSDVSDICPKTTWTGFPNVFDPKWEAYCDVLARNTVRTAAMTPGCSATSSTMSWSGTGRPTPSGGSSTRR